MPIHDWTRVDAGIFHAFHHGWIEEIARALNRGALPADYYALPEQQAAGFGPDELTLQERHDADLAESSPAESAADASAADESAADSGAVLAPPNLKPTAVTDMAFYRRKQKTVTVRHVSGDRIVAVVEVVSPGNKAARNPLRSVVAKAAELLEQQAHLMILDLLPRGPRDPDGMHGEIWQEIAGQEYTAPVDKPLAFAGYESGATIKAYVVPAAVGDTLKAMPLFLEPEKAIELPLDATYMSAFNELPQRWRRELD